jgi:acetolactate synthase-1/2/3 large subunit
MLENLSRKLRRPTERLTGGAVVARMLKAEGVDAVFGIIDGTYFGFYSALPGLGIRQVSPRHESCAAHMAGAYARLTGRLGVCMASNGPGVANVLPGIAVEHAEGNRVLLITSCRREGTIAPDRGGTYQSFPQVEVSAPMVKWSCRVPSFARLPEIMRKALRLSFTGRPGVVHVDVPENVMNGRFELRRGWLTKPSQYRGDVHVAPPDEQVSRAADLLISARQPMIHSGSGVIHAQAFRRLADLAELLDAPVTTSWGARGAMPETAPWAIPMIAVELTTRVRNEADLVLVLGSRLGETDWWGKAPYWARPSRQKVVQVDCDPAMLGVNRPLELGIVADVGLFLDRLVAVVRARVGEVDRAARQAALSGYREAWLVERARLDEKLADRASPLHPAHVGHICRRELPDDTVAVFDGGNATIWGQFFHEVREPNTVVWTAHFGMLGAGVAHALGAQVARPASRVVCIIGDGAMGFHPQEIETAVRCELPVIWVVMCDRQWGMVKINQSFAMKPVKTLVKKHLDPGENINTDFSEIRFDALAEAMGAHGERVASPDALAPALRRCLASGRASVIHVDVDPVKHMWAPALKHFKDMHQEPKG